MAKHNKDAISFGGGSFKVGTEPRISLWCLNNDYQSCAIIIPESSYKQIDSIVTEYARGHNVAATIGFRSLNTESPVLMPVSMSIASYKRYFQSLSDYMLNKLPPPSEFANELFNNADFVDQDELIVQLKRMAKNYNMGDFFTIDKKGNTIETFSLLDEITKPITTMEMYKAKLKLFFKL